MERERGRALDHHRSMDTAHWPPQELGLVKPMGELLGASTLPTTTTTSTVMINSHNDNNMLTRPPAAAAAAAQVMERRARPQKEQALSCPRCNSTNTKFCYYNNYSLTQPRYFCKTCRRYWTEGGSLRNVPVGGGSRKNKRSSNSSASISTTSTATAATSSPSTLSNISHSSKKLVASSVASHDLTQDQDLNLSFAAATTTNTDNNSNTNCSSAMDLLRGRGLGPFMPMPMPMPDAGRVYPAGFGLHHHEFRAPTASGFSMDGDQISGGGRLLFPFEEARQVSASSATNGHHHHHHHHHQFDQQQSRGQGMDPSPGFWNGMIGGGGPW